MRVHPVGSVPAQAGRGPDESMRWLLAHRNTAELTALPCDDDPRWIVDWLDGLAASPAVRIVRGGDSRDYGSMPTYRPTDDGALSPSDLALGRVEQTARALAAMERLASEFVVPARFQVSVPHTLDRALFASGSPQAAPAWAGAVHASLAEELTGLAAEHGDRVQFQLETPATLASYHATPREEWPELTDRLVSSTADTIAITASAAPWVLHLCCGDLGRKPFFEPLGLDTAVMFVNALADELENRGLPIPAVHIPFCTGTSEPPSEERFYRPLSTLRRTVGVIAGLVDETAPDASHHALRLTIDALGVPPLAIGASCGLGRRSLPQAAANMRLAATMTTTHNGTAR